MVASEFYAFGPEVGSSKGQVKLKVTGIGFDGAVQFEVDGENYMLTTDEIESMSNRDLLATKAEFDRANKDLKTALKEIPALPDKASNETKNHLHQAKKELFRAAVRSAE